MDDIAAIIRSHPFARPGRRLDGNDPLQEHHPLEAHDSEERQPIREQMSAAAEKRMSHASSQTRFNSESSPSERTLSHYGYSKRQADRFNRRLVAGLRALARED